MTQTDMDAAIADYRKRWNAASTRQRTLMLEQGFERAIALMEALGQMVGRLEDRIEACELQLNDGNKLAN